MLTEVNGLVLRTTNVGDFDRMLTIYTDKMGVVSAMCKHARSLKSRNMPAVGQFCYSSFVLLSKGDKYWVQESSLIDSFYGLHTSIEGLALAAYIVDVLSDVATAESDEELLRLALNSLYALANGKADVSKVKAAFEIRAAAALGFMPEVLACHTCSEEHGEFFFDIMAGAIECRACRRKAERTHTPLSEEHESHIVCMLSETAKIALAYCIYSPLEKLFSFNMPDEDMDLFCRATEAYLTNHLERGFKTLDFYNEVKR